MQFHLGYRRHVTQADAGLLIQLKSRSPAVEMWQYLGNNILFFQPLKQSIERRIHFGVSVVSLLNIMCTGE